MESRYGPGSRLQFKSGEGHAQVQIRTKSGDVRLCVKGMAGAAGGGVCPPARVARLRMAVPYVY